MGIVTGGGDCPGLNAVIRAVVRRGINAHGFEIAGFRNGWAGVLAGDSFELTHDNTSGILHRGGTILGTSRTNPYADEGGGERVRPASTRSWRWAARTHWVWRTGSMPTASMWWASPRRSTTTSEARTSPSGS